MENQNQASSSAGNGAGSSPGGNSCGPCQWCGCVDWKLILSRAKEVFLSPKGCWTSIKAEELSAKDLYLKYAVGLAAIPAICGFIKQSIIGISIPLMGTSYRVPFFSGLVHMIAAYLLMLLGFYIVAVVFEKLAPKFEGQVSQIDALKLVVFAATPAMVGGIFTLLPVALSALLGLLLGIYGLYLGYVGVGEMTSVPAAKKLLYYIVSIVFGAVAMFIIHLIAAAFLPSQTPPEAVLPNVNINFDQLLNKLPK